MRTSVMDGQVSLFGPDSEYGKTYPAPFPAAGIRKREKNYRGRISESSSSHFSRLKNHTLMLLDLRPGAGNMLGPCWEYDPPWLGPPGTLNTSECPKGVVESSLSRILQATVPSKYYLTSQACLGILGRAKKRGKPLPPQLEMALMLQAGLMSTDRLTMEPLVFHINQREETIDLGDKAGALLATRNMQMQTFVAAGFCAGAGPSAGSLGYQEEVSPTLKASPSGNMAPSVLCLNDQGETVMECSENMFENHGMDSRYTGPHPVAPTMSARYGTGGNNVPLVTDDITVFSRQRVDAFMADDVTSTQSARQGKDATDLVWQICPGEMPKLIRRLTPLECERLQGFPDGWTDIPRASDSARYKALGNSVAIPCVDFLVQGIALVLRAGL